MIAGDVAEQVLAGDAAHPIPPNLAQGAGQSLVDAASLLRWMADDNLDSALSGYARERSKAVGVIFKKACGKQQNHGA
jgi:salicylate hydroxylase